jgi:hypothetical protein
MEDEEEYEEEESPWIRHKRRVRERELEDA